MDKALMESYYEAYNSEDPERLRAFYCPDVELTSAEGVMRGADEVLATFRSLTAIFHDKMTPQRITVDGDEAVVEILDNFTAKCDIDDFMGMALKEGDTFALNLRGTYRAQDGRFKTITIEML